MNLKTLSMMGALLLLAGTGANAQKKKEVLNDSNTPLHLLQPAYKVPYGMLTTEEIKADMDRVLRYLEKNTPTRVVDKNTGKVITDYANMTADAQLERGAFRLASYEWGVTYSAMLAAAEATGDQAYYKYVTDRFQFLAEVAPHFRKVLEKYGTVDPQMKQILTPHALDDAGAVCAAMVKVQMKENSPELKPLIDNYMDFIVNKEYRLADGTFARTRPQHNTLWLDDMFMGIPPVAWYSCIAGDKKQMYLSEAVRQIFQFADRMWVPGKNLFRHGWVEGMQDHPAFHWGRANGWALLTMCEVLDVLPEDYPQRDKILELFRAHVRGLAACQSGEGFWHQLLDRNDSYLETSATAIYVYCFAHAINKGWIDAMAYGPVAQLGWHAVTTQINAEGQVDGTCVGTGMAFDPAFYYYRPVNVYAAHGYGPVLWAGAEMINLLNKQHPKMNDSAVQYYRTEQKTSIQISLVTLDGRHVYAALLRKYDLSGRAGQTHDAPPSPVVSVLSVPSELSVLSSPQEAGVNTSTGWSVPSISSFAACGVRQTPPASLALSNTVSPGKRATSACHNNTLPSAVLLRISVRCNRSATSFVTLM